MKINISNWELYDALIEGIPEDLLADEIVCGAYKALVRCGDGIGIGNLNPEDTRPVNMITKRPGMRLRDLAGAVKSWNFVEASIGQAAINAYYNSVATARQNGIQLSNNKFSEDRIHDPFIMYQNLIRNKKVAVVGHFKYLEKLFLPVCDLSILEQPPQEDDYSYSAAEYILPYSDFVFISSCTLVDKSLPRFLSLAQKAHVVLVGPSTTMAPVLSRFGVTNLCGFIIKDSEKAFRICTGQEDYKIYTTGQKVNLKFDNIPGMCGLASNSCLN